MNQLFLRPKSKTLMLLLTALFINLITTANPGNPQNEFFEICKESDAYLVHSYTDIVYTKSWGSYKRFVTVTNKMVVNNRAGVDKYAYINLSEHVVNNIYQIDIKTLKSTGNIIELDSSQVIDQKKIGKKLGSINYPIPGVEPGDTIQTTYTYSEFPKKHERMDFVHLYHEVPSLRSEYSIRTDDELIIRYKTYNEFPEPQVVVNDTMVYSVFSMKEVQGLDQNDYTCLPCELPYMYYTMEKSDSEPADWKGVYNDEFNLITQPMSLDPQNSAYYRRWKRDVLGSAKDSSKYIQFNILHRDIINNFKMEETVPEEFFKSSGYFLKQNRFDPNSIRRMYRQLLEDLEIEYWAVFARSKRAGKIDPYYIRRGEYDHVFFAFEDDQGNLNLLYPHESSYKYQINEIPTTIFNTNAIIAKPHLNEKLKRKQKFIDRDLELAEVDSVTVSLIKLPGTNANHNVVKQILYSKVDMEKKETPLKYRFTISGGLFTELKGFMQLLAENEEVSEFYGAMEEVEGNKDVIEIDSITDFSFKAKKPFSYTMNAEGKLRDAVSFLNENMVSISLDKLIEHYQIKTEKESSDLNYYLDFAFTDYEMVILNFPNEIEVIGIDAYNSSIKNDVGEYYFKLQHIGGNELTLQSSYKINTDEIKTDAYTQLLKLNELVKEVKNKHIMVKIKAN